MRQPRGAEDLMKLRSRGKRPLAVVVTDNKDFARCAVSLTGQLALEAGPGEWDMRSIHALPVVVWSISDDLLGLVESIDICDPESITVIAPSMEKHFFDTAKRLLNG